MSFLARLFNPRARIQSRSELVEFWNGYKTHNLKGLIDSKMCIKYCSDASSWYARNTKTDLDVVKKWENDFFAIDLKEWMKHYQHNPTSFWERHK